MLDSAVEFLNLRSPPGNIFEKLGDDRQGQYSIRINIVGIPLNRKIEDRPRFYLVFSIRPIVQIRKANKGNFAFFYIIEILFLPIIL